MSGYSVAGVTESVAGPRAVWELVRQRPRTAMAAAILLVLSGLAEGLGLMTLLPLLSVATEGSTLDLPAVGEIVITALGWLGLSASLGVLVAVIVVALTAKAGLKVLALWRVGAAEAAVTAELRRAMVSGFLRARWPYFVRQPTGSLANAIGTESMRASKVFTQSAQVVAAVVLLVVYTVLALMVSWQMAAVGMVVGLGAARGLRLLVRISKAAGKDRTNAQNSLIARFNDALYTIKPLKAMGQEHRVAPMLEPDIRDYERAQRRTVTSRVGVEAAYEPVAAVALGALLYVSVAFVGLPFEQLLFLAFLVQRTVIHVGKVQREWQQLQNNQYALRVVSGAITQATYEAESTGGRKPPTLEQELTFEGVSFSYGDHWVLEDCWLTIPARRFTGLVGPSGVGKTTLVDLLVGLQQPTSGQVTVDGVSLNECDLALWRAQIGYVPQETVLFHDTVRANLTVGHDTVADELLAEALASAGALSFIRELPQGLDTVVGEHGQRLSGGQRQRLAIARALVRRPSLLILDEATTALDPATEATILETLEGLRGQLTILAISHQHNVARSADQIIDLPGPRQQPTVRAGGAASGVVEN